jgi:cytochrome c
LLAGPPARGEFVGHGGAVRGIAVSPDSRQVLSASFDYSIILWDFASQRPLHRLHGHEGLVNAVAFLDGGRALSASDDGTLALWNLNDAKLEKRWPGHGAKIAGLAVSANRKLALSGGWDRGAKLWELPSGRLLQTLDHGANVNAVAFSPDGISAATAGHDGSVRLWRLSDGNVLQRFGGGGFAANALAFSADGKRLLVAQINEKLRLWDLAQGQVAVDFVGHEGPVMSAAVSPDGQFALSGGTDGMLRLWRMADGQPLRDVFGHHRPIWSVAFAAQGQVVLSGGADGRIRAWNVRDGQALGAPAAVAAASPAGALDDSRGAALFRKCLACHTVTADGGNRAGPSLYGVFGRRAGQVAGYAYSEALRKNPLIWSEQTVDDLFRLGPDEFTPGSKMPLQRMPDPEDRAELIRYLKQITTPRN